jgi:hypothetical protein
VIAYLCQFHGLLFEADQVEVAANTVLNDAMFGFMHAGIVSESPKIRRSTPDDLNQLLTTVTCECSPQLSRRTCREKQLSSA